MSLNRTTNVSISSMRPSSSTLSRTPRIASRPASVTMPQVAIWPAGPSSTVTARVRAAPVAVAHSPCPSRRRWPFSVKTTPGVIGSCW